MSGLFFLIIHHFLFFVDFMVTINGCLIGDALMGSLIVIKATIFFQLVYRLPNHLQLDRMPPFFDQGMIGCFAFSIHTSRNRKTIDGIRRLPRSQRTALVRIQYLRAPIVFDCFIDSLQTLVYRHGIGTMKADHKTTIWIDDGTEITPSA